MERHDSSDRPGDDGVRDRHDDSGDFLAVPEDDPAVRRAGPYAVAARRRVRPLALVGAAVLVGGALVGASVLAQRPDAPARDTVAAAGTTPTATPGGAGTAGGAGAGGGTGTTGGADGSGPAAAPASPAAPGQGTGAPAPSDAVPLPGRTSPGDRAPGSDDARAPGPDGSGERAGRGGWLGPGGLLDHGGGRHGGDDRDADRLVGTLTSVDATSLVLDAPGGPRTLAVDAGTEVVRDHEHASTADLAAGQDVLVRVSASGDTADLVVVDPSAGR